MPMLLLSPHGDKSPEHRSHGLTKTTPFRHSHQLWPVSGLTSDPICLPMQRGTVAFESDCMEIHALVYRCGGSTRWQQHGDWAD